MLSRLSKLEEDLNDFLSNQEDEKSELRNEIGRIKKEVDFLKSTLDTLSKKGWLKALAIKLFNWSKDPVNRSLISSGFEAAQELLPEIKDIMNVD